jgi:ATP-dependent DNA helicase RecG
MSMTHVLPIRLTTPIAAIPGVRDDREANAFAHLGLRSVADLIRHLPLRYEQELAEGTIAAAETAIGPQGANIAVRGQIGRVRVVKRRRFRIEASLEDDTGTLQLTWFNTPWLRGRLHPGMTIRVQGRATRVDSKLQMTNPGWERLDQDDDNPAPARQARLRPVYPASDDLASVRIETVIDGMLDEALTQLDDHLHEAYRQQAALPTLAEAYRMMHRPQSDQDILTGRRRLALDELLLLQLGVMIKRHHRRQRLHAIALKHNQAIDAHITERIPFQLTDGQRHVIDRIVTDLQQPIPMNRLLQGDVGAGKTVVAVYAMLVAVASGHQAALMAPTELLAEQHLTSIRRLLSGGRASVELLTGSLKAVERDDICRRLAQGQVDLVVGTHALLTGDVQFPSLALVVIDEQHRFGVHQRATMRAKTADPDCIPHTLVMTATPIPRTLSLTIFGDLDISTITGMPPGRVPVITRHVTADKAREVYDYMATRIDAGEQAYVVVPVIDESESGLTDVHSHLKWLEQGPLARRRIAALHGRLKRDEREAVMERFVAGQIDVLVATTVIEVGIDVPNASMIVIEHADRFGLAQLHQLRGRVNRSTRQALCVLVSEPPTPEAQNRIDAIVASDNGFDIAERDLEIRGPGVLFGARQSGLAPFRVAQLPRDMDLLGMARRDAEAWIDQNPTLAGQRDALLKRRLLKAHGEALGLGDVG